jgi:hypothetical protein
MNDMNSIIAWFAGSKAADMFSTVQQFLQHKKCYALGTLGIVTGIVGLWGEIAGMNGLSDAINLARHASSDPNIQAIWAGAALCAGKAAVQKTAMANDSDGPNIQEGPTP